MKPDYRPGGLTWLDPGTPIVEQLYIPVVNVTKETPAMSAIQPKDGLPTGSASNAPTGSDRPQVLNERRNTHGRFKDNAEYGQRLKNLFRDSQVWSRASAEHREALDYIAGKLARILSGQSKFKDHWIDIAGYAHLGAEACDDRS